MLLDVSLFVAFAALGLALQRAPWSARLRAAVWSLNLAVIIPAAAVYALLGADIDLDLLAVLACGVTGWWATVGIAALYARLVTSRPGPTRGALTLIGAFPNTGFIGFPLALSVYGTEGLRIAVLFDQVSLVIPAVVVGSIIARRAATGERTDIEQRRILHEVLVSPPLWAVLLTLVVRATWVRDPVDLELLGQTVGHVVGPVGFLLLGLSVPLGARVRDRVDSTRVLGAVAVRIAIAPAAVASVAWASGTDVPAALIFVAGLPTAFHAMIVARVHDVEPSLVRMGVITSTLLGVFVITPIAVGIG